MLTYATINGRTVSFGPDEPEARREFEAFLASWLAAGRQLPDDDAPPPVPLTVDQLIEPFATPYFWRRTMPV